MTLAPQRPATAARLSPRFVLVIVGSLAVACAGLAVDGTPLDFSVYTSAGHALQHGNSLYGLGVRVRGYGFTYPPFAGLVLAPLAMLPHAAALATMTGVSIAALGIVIRLSAPEILRAALRPRATGALLALAAMIACEPVRATLWQGQINLVLAAVVLVDLLAPEHVMPPSLRGVGVGLAAAVKLTPAVFIAYLLVCRRYRAAANATLAFVGATCAAWLVLPADSGRFWFRDLYAGSGIGDASRGSNILGLLLRTMPAGSASALWVVLSLPVGLAGLLLARRQSCAGREAYALGIIGVTGCLISPVTWTHHWVWCVPWLANHGWHALRQRGRARIIGGAVAAAYVATGLVPSHLLSGVPVLGFAAANVFVLGVVLVTAGALLPHAAELTRRETPGAPSRR